MEAAIEQIPQTGDIQLTIQIKAQFNYSAIVAKRLVRRFLADEVGYLLRVGDPTLVAAERIVWRVPVLLAYPQTGTLGQVGSVDVDVEDGHLFLDQDRIDQIKKSAIAFSSHHVTPSTTS